jgi:S1-C subfamily serine protease
MSGLLVKLRSKKGSLIKIISLLAVLVVVMAFAIGCTTQSDTSTGQTTPGTTTGSITGNTVVAASLFDENTVVSLYEHAIPAVVKIETTVTGGTQNFGPFQFNVPAQKGQGSGFFIDNEGYILTNNHVVDNASNVTVITYNDKNVSAKVIGTDKQNDLALVKVDPKDLGNITPLALGDSDKIRPGHMAIALGSPYGLDGSITVGIISGIGRSLSSTDHRAIADVIQTDAAINPGNSGGPLLNSSGEVIGINTAIEANATSIGFAVPINTARSILPALKQGGEIKNAWLGISGMPINSEMAASLNLPVESGVYIVAVIPDSPAAKAGLVESGVNSQQQPTTGGDIVVAIDGSPVTRVEDIIEYLNGKQPGDKVTLDIYRNNEEIQVTVELGEWPEQMPATEITPPNQDEFNFPFDWNQENPPDFN